jgi:DNA-binding GntR family transcriptional regulator
MTPGKRSKVNSMPHPSSTSNSLNNQAYERIRFDIVTFTLQPGEKISEADLAARYRLGRASIRSALQRLVGQGLVTNRRRLGHIVTPITVHDIRDIFQLRQLLEPEAVTLAVGRLTKQNQRELRAACRIPRPGPPENREAKVRFLMANRAFCITIARACGNERLGTAIEQLQDLTLRVLYLGLRPTTSKRAEGFQTNDLLLKAILAGDESRARETYVSSLKASERWILSNLLDLPNFRTYNLAQMPVDLKIA